MNTILRRRGSGRSSLTGIAEAMSEQINIVRNDRIRAGPSPIDFLFRWGCVTPMNHAGITVNTSEMIHWCQDKRASRLAMQDAGVSVPQTWAAEEFNGVSLQEQFVLRPPQHAQGRHLVTGHATVMHHTIVIDPIYSEGYVSRLINKVAEYRVFVIQNRIAWVARKTPGNPQDVAWNVAQGGRFDNVAWEDWPAAVTIEALKAARVGGIDFGGVDVIVDADGKAYVLEINSAVALESPYRTLCTAKAFDYIVQHGKEYFPNPERIKTYRSVIHPAIRTPRE